MNNDKSLNEAALSIFSKFLFTMVIFMCLFAHYLYECHRKNIQGYIFKLITTEGRNACEVHATNLEIS